MSEITELELQIPSPPHVDEDDTVFVALGKDVKKDEKVLTWALHYSRGRKICVLHIHQPARMIPMMGSKVSINLLDEHIVSAYHENERQGKQKILDKYVRTCGRTGVQVEMQCKEMDSIEKGIVQLISQLSIKWLVMGAGASKSCSRGNETILKKIFFVGNSSRKFTIPKSKKATYVRLKAPSSCHISFIWEGDLIHTRESNMDGINIYSGSACLQASLDAENMQLSSRSHSVTERQNDRLYLLGSLKNFRRFRSYDHGKRILSPPDSSCLVTSRRRLNPEWSTDQDSPSRESKVDEINVEKVSASLQASPNAETSQSLLRNLSVTEGRNDRINLPDSAPNYEDRQSGRSPSVGSLFSTCPSSEIIEDTASVSCPSTDENEIWLEFPMPEDNEGGVHCHSSAAFSSFEDVYHRFAQFVTKAEIFQRDVHEELSRRKQAENDVIDAIGKAKASATRYTELLRHRLEIEESLARSKEEVEKMKCELVEVMNAHRSQIADSD
ncbi:Hypothetical predicted protein [Olea europaea subsp. europaea]|uniref:RING-type E3 ubiquitin transferase n=1 Tax=Olea europaea subsp. europaea TaxID=158383 RepID=A0A8S0S1S9_OLEEU|nr:Hypothetical predicted protein [Olea europaea subsp. europaea]